MMAYKKKKIRYLKKAAGKIRFRWRIYFETIISVRSFVVSDGKFYKNKEILFALSGDRIL